MFHKWRFASYRSAQTLYGKHSPKRLYWFALLIMLNFQSAPRVSDVVVDRVGDSFVQFLLMGYH